MSAPTQEEVTRLIAANERATADSDYADTVVFNPVNIEGTRYKYVLTNAPDPRQ